VVGDAGVAVSGEEFTGGVLDVLARDPETRRTAARARAEEFGWPASVAAFLAVHQALNTDSLRTLGQVQA
jgi:alpha-1,6-mannosyltransferase